MERKSGIESGSLEPISTETFPYIRVLLLFALMLLPWAIMGFGLLVLQDYRLTMLMYGIVCCILPTLLFRQKPIRFWPIRMRFLPLIGIILGLNLLLLGFFHFTHFGIQPNAFQPNAERIHLTLSTQALEYGLYFVIMNPILEETFWRGFIYEEWKRLVPSGWACLITSFFFGAWHWMIVQLFCTPLWAILLTMSVMIGGLIMARLYEKTGTLGATILAHSFGGDLPLLLIIWMLLKAGTQ